MQGYIKIHRNILEWEWWSDINTYRLFTYMILRANWKDGKFKGLDIKKGSFVSSVRKLSEETNLTENEIRTAIKHLIKTNEITSKTHGKFTVFTVNNYLLYQEDNEQLTSKSQADNEQITDKSQTDNEQLTSSSQPVNDLLTPIEEKKESNNTTVSNETVCQTDVRLIVETWNKLQEYGVKPILKLSSSSKRYQMLAARIRQYSTTDILSAIDKVKASDFLQGKNNKDWMITFDWFVRPNNFPKVLEGHYDNANKQNISSAQYSTQKSSNRFNDFSQRNYDYGEFEKNFVNKGLI